MRLLTYQGHATFGWSNTQDKQQQKPENENKLNGLLSAVLITAIVLVLFDDVSHNGLFGCSNGRFVSFLQSIHAIDRYWWRSQYFARSLAGTTMLKFAGSTLISLFIGAEPIWWSSKRHTVSFLIAYAVVRSDSKESAWLSDRMRSHASAQASLGLVAAVYRLRKMIFVAECTQYVGQWGALCLGLVAFSAANLTMIAEGAAVSVMSLQSEPVRTPNLRDTLLRNSLMMALLIWGSGSAYLCIQNLCNLLVLLYLVYYYNRDVLSRMARKWTYPKAAQQMRRRFSFVDSITATDKTKSE